jgi:hypothetical protein
LDCVVAVRDLDTLAEVFVAGIRRPPFGNGESSEAKLSHLQVRLDRAGLSVSDLADVDVLDDKRVVTCAREKVSGRVSLEGRACTPAMLDTPRRRLERRARYGRWQSFPSDPTRFFEKVLPSVNRNGFVTKGKVVRCGIADREAPGRPRRAAPKLARPARALPRLPHRRA